MVSTRSTRKRKEMAIDEARKNSSTDQKCSRRQRPEEVPVPCAPTPSHWSFGGRSFQKTHARSASFSPATRILNPTVKSDPDCGSPIWAAQLIITTHTIIV